MRCCFLLKNYKRRPTQLDPYVREFYIHGESALFTRLSRIWVFWSAQSLFVASCIFFPFYLWICWVLFFAGCFRCCCCCWCERCRHRHLYNFDFGKRLVGADFVWLSTKFFGLGCNRRMYAVCVVEIIVLQLQPHTYVDRLVHSPRKRNETYRQIKWMRQKERESASERDGTVEGKGVWEK